MKLFKALFTLTFPRSVPLLFCTFLIGTGIGCKTRENSESSLWAAETATAFGKLVKNGRSIAPKETNNSSAMLALDGNASNSTFSFAGVRPSSLELDTVSNVLIHATFNTTQSVVLPKSATLATEAQRLIFSNAQVIGIDPTELVHSSDINQQSGKWTTISFSRVVSGIPVRDARIDMVFSGARNDWRLAEIINRGWGKAEEAGAVQTQKLTASQLSGVTGVAGLKIVASGAQYVPRKDPKTQKTTLHRANWYEVKGKDSAHFTLTFSGAEGPKLLEAFSHHYDVTVVASVFERSWTQAKINVPVADAAIVTSQGGTQSLDSQGSTPTTDPNAMIKTASSWATVRTEAGVVPQFRIVNQGGTAVVDASGPNVPELNTYVAISRIRQFVKQFLSDNETGYFAQKLAVTTQLTKNCNAFYEGGTLNFFSEGGGCADMATVNDVIMHEWGHGLDDYTGPGTMQGGGITDSAFSEGVGDITTMMYTGDNHMAAGFFTTTPTKDLRNLENKKVYVPGQEDEIHKQGTIIGGAFWELRRRMVNKYGPVQGGQKAANLFFKHLVEADSYRDSYNIVVRLADDDGNPATKGPEFCIVNHSFAQKGLAERDPCVDDFDSGSNVPTMPQDGLDLHLAIASEDTNGTTFEASTAKSKVQSIELCTGQGCTSAEITMAFASQRGDRRIFSSSVPMPLQGGKVIRIVSKDANGAVVDSVHVRIKGN